MYCNKNEDIIDIYFAFYTYNLKNSFYSYLFKFSSTWYYITMVESTFSYRMQQVSFFPQFPLANSKKSNIVLDAGKFYFHLLRDFFLFRTNLNYTTLCCSSSFSTHIHTPTPTNLHAKVDCILKSFSCVTQCGKNANLYSIFLCI